jgi:mRNA-degrading endonuclease RelE of RelBE toxin-antitoxin system
MVEAEATGEFQKDIKKLTAKDRERLDEIIRRLSASERLGKQLHHLKEAYSIRIENKRLVYQILGKEAKVRLLFFKSREDVYEYLGH